MGKIRQAVKFTCRWCGKRNSTFPKADGRAECKGCRSLIEPYDFENVAPSKQHVKTEEQVVFYMRKHIDSQMLQHYNTVHGIGYANQQFTGVSQGNRKNNQKNRQLDEENILPATEEA